MSSSENDLLAPWKVLGSEESFRTKWFGIQRYSCVTPDGRKVDYYVHEAPDSVMCACITEKGYVVVERQYRFPLRDVSMDYPAGYVEPDDRNLERAALRELREETGFVADKATFLFSLAKDPSFSSGKMHVYLATNAHQVTVTPYASERLIIQMLRPEEILEAVRTGEMSCAFCVATTLRLAQILKW